MKEKPDGRWSWLVVVAAALTRVVVYGVGYTSGVVYTIILEVFHMSKGDTSWISSVVTATMYFSGLFGGFLVDRYGCRKTAFAGGIMATTGMIGSAFSVNISMLIIFYGVVTGTGIGLTFVPISVAVSVYHNKRRNLALGMASAGGGIGTLVFPPLIKYLNFAYGWRGMFLILSGVAMNICVIALLFRPVVNEDSNIVIEIMDDVEEGKQPETTQRLLNKDEKDKTAEEDKKDEDSKKHGNGINSANGEDKKLLKETKSSSSVECKVSVSPSKCNCSSSSFFMEICYKFKDVFGFRMFAFCLNNMFVAFGTSIIYGHLDAYSQYELGFQTYEAAMAYSLIGIFVMIGKFTHGVIANWKPRSPIVILFLCYLVNGAMTLLLLLQLNYPGLLIYSVVYGFTYAALGGAISPALLIQLVGVDGLAFSYGIIYASVGIGKLFGAPAAGFVIDQVDSYTYPFIVASGTIILSALVMIPWFRRVQKPV